METVKPLKTGKPNLPQALFVPRAEVTVDRLCDSVELIPSVGKVYAEALGRLRIRTIMELLCHRPRSIRRERYITSLEGVAEGDWITAHVTLVGSGGVRLGGKSTRLVAKLPSGHTIDLVFFRGAPSFLFSGVTTTWLITGVLKKFRDIFQIAHPQCQRAKDTAPLEDRWLPVYPMTYGLTDAMISRWIAWVWERLVPPEEWIETALRERYGWPSWKEALGRLHGWVPADGESKRKALQRLSYDEWLAEVVALQLLRQEDRRVEGYAHPLSTRHVPALRAVLPWHLTEGQEASWERIAEAMASPHRMMMLLQGDVGSGKTVIAWMAMLTSVEAGYQAACMAPTELLAEQHHRWMSSMSEAMGLAPPALLTSKTKPAARRTLLAGLADGSIGMVVGTHALLQEAVAWHRLSVAVIDEQHRFGVEQRLTLASKSSRPVDILVMTATPIPRSLALTLAGDMDVVRLEGKPAGRRPIETRILSVHRWHDLLDFLRKHQQEGEQIYWICPAIGGKEEEEEDEKEEAVEVEGVSGRLPLRTVEERFELLEEALPDWRIGVVHGRQKPADRERAMAAFVSGELSLLVATTVIEVGIDVPNATIIVIEHAERFGLSQLHQLRGRVGRGSRPSYCFLLYHGRLSDVARQRLSVLRGTEDGFVLAEEDWKLRGSGEILGTQQSGHGVYRWIDPWIDGPLRHEAKADAEGLLAQDPALASDRGHAVRRLLALFNKQDAARYLDAG
jgi:ATP-dependent DNA helicase RecG